MDGCNLCRSTVFLSEVSATTVTDQDVVINWRKDNARKNKTDLWFYTTKLGSAEPKIPEEAHEAKPDGISCLLNC